MESAEVGDPGADELEAGRKLFARPATFMHGRGEARPAAAGGSARGRVGRPLQRRQVEPDQCADRAVAASRAPRNTPGRTQQINLFDLSRPPRSWSTCPATATRKAPKDMVERWTRLVFAYLRGRPSLMRVCLLIDARHGIKKVDEEAIELLGKAAVPIPGRAHQGRPGAAGRAARR